MWMKCSCSKHAMFFRSPWSPAALPALASPERDSFCDRRKRAFEEPPDGAGSSSPDAGGGKAARSGVLVRNENFACESFFVHHTQQLAAAAQVGDAKGIRKKITEMKMRLIKVPVALKATGRG